MVKTHILQKKEAITCIVSLLSNSSHISKLFSKNISDMLKVYNVPFHIILYLLTFTKVESHRQQQILNELLSLFKADNMEKKHEKAREKYFSKVVFHFATSSYRILSFYENSELSHLLPKLAPIINEIKC